MMVASGARMRRSVATATASSCASETRRYSAVASAASRIAVPVADSQLNVKLRGLGPLVAIGRDP